MSKESDSLISLERVLGLTALSSAAVAASPSGDLFYAAGCVCVQYSPTTNKQLGFFNAQKPISCAAVSTCGKYLAIGERGHNPCVCIYSIASGTIITRLAGHKHGISCMVFSPDSKHLVTCGFKHDKQLLLWEWDPHHGSPPPAAGSSAVTSSSERSPAASSTRPLCTAKIGSKVYAVDFHESGSYFVTCGDRHFKFWTLQRAGGDGRRGTIVGLTGAPGTITQELTGTAFMDVKCGSGRYSNTIYTCTASGYLAAFHESRVIDTWVKLESPTAYSLALFMQANADGLLVVGCAEGIIRAFSPGKLTYLATLPLPAPLLAHANELEYAACYCLCKVPGSKDAPVPKLASIYADRSLFVWDISDIHAVAQYRTFSFHRACVWDVAFVDRRKESPDDKQEQCLPPGSFATCSADSTIKLWNLDPRQQRLSHWKSPHSREMLHVIELQNGKNPDTTSSQDSSSSIGVNSSLLNSSSVRGSDQDGGIGKALAAGPADGSVNFSCGIPDTELPHRPQETLAPRALAVHPCGTQLACGDKSGRLRVYDLHSMRLLHNVKSHAAEILSLHYSPPQRQMDDATWAVDYTSVDAEADVKPALTMLATAGRDRLVHVYDVGRSYVPITTLDNHSSSITALRFTADGKRLLSCGGDRTMVFSSVAGPEITRFKSVATPHGTVNGLALEPTNKFAITSGQDKRLNIWNVQSGKHMRTYKSPAIVQELYKADVDPSGMFVAASAFDKTLNLFDFFSGELLAQVTGHSEVVTGVRFSLDGRHLVSIGGDGCIMVWRLHDSLVRVMQDRLVELYGEAAQRQASVLRRSQNSLKKLREKESLKALQSQAKGQANVPPAVPAAQTAAAVATPSSTATAATAAVAIAPPPAPASKEPAAEAAAAGKWTSRLHKEGGYQLFGRQVGPNPNSLALAPVEFTGILDVNGIGVNVGDGAESSSRGSTLTRSAVISPHTVRLAQNVEADDDVMCGSDSEAEPGEEEEEEEEEDDGESLFRGQNREATPEPISQSQLLGRSQEGAHLRASLEASARLDAELEEDDSRAQLALDQLERSAADLETWLEAKLRGDTKLDSTVSSKLQISDGRAAAYLVDETAGAAENPADKSPTSATWATSLNGINNDEGLLSNSLSAAFFRGNRAVLASNHANYAANTTNTGAVSELNTNESAASVDISVSSAGTGASGTSKGSKLASKRAQTSAALAHMKHQLHGMGLLEGTLDAHTAAEAISGSVTAAAAAAAAAASKDKAAKPAAESPLKINTSTAAPVKVAVEEQEEQEDTTMISNDVWMKPAVVMPPSPPLIHAIKLNASIDAMHSHLRKKAEAEAATSPVNAKVEGPHQENPGYTPEAAAATKIDDDKETENDKDNEKEKQGFNFSLTSDDVSDFPAFVSTNSEKSALGFNASEAVHDDDDEVNAADITANTIEHNDKDDGGKDGNEGDDSSTVTASTRSGSLVSSRHDSLDLSVTGGAGDENAVKIAVLGAEQEQSDTDREGGVTSSRESPAREDTKDDDAPDSEISVWDGDVTSQAAETAIARTTIREMQESGLSSGVAGKSSGSRGLNPVSQVSQLPSQAALKSKLDAHAQVLADLNRARDAALQSYNDLLGLRSGLVDVSVSFSDSSSSAQESSSTNSRGYGSWTRPQDAEAALGVTNNMLSSFRHSFAEMPKSMSSRITGAHTHTDKESTSSSDRSRSGERDRDRDVTDFGSFSRSVSTPRLGASVTSIGDGNVVDIEELLESHSDKLMEKMMAKLVASGHMLPPKI